MNSKFSARLKQAFTFLSSRMGWGLFAGLVWACAFPKINIPGLAWLAPGLLLWGTRHQNARQAFALGYTAGLTFYLTTLYWLLLIPYRWHGLPLGPALGWLILSAFLALYPAAWCWLCSQMQKAHQASATPPTSTWRGRTFWALQCAALWVAWEMLQARLLTGFPWNFLGTSQFKLTPLIQIASVTGVSGLSFLIVWFSVSLGHTTEFFLRAPATRRIWAVEILLPTLVILLAWLWGWQRLPPSASSEKKIKLALVQPSIPQEVIWNPAENENRFAKLMRLSQAALAEKPDVLVWPEASVSGFTTANLAAITNLIVTHQVAFVFGADDVETTDGPARFYNSAFHFSADGSYAATYRKRQLVMFGEYVPLAKWLPFLNFFTPIEGGFTPGQKSEPFHLVFRSPHETSPLSLRFAQTSVLICFEDIFARLARDSVGEDTDFLLNLTNDGWFGHSANQWQHAINALFRAVENGIPLVRCTNNGLTCWIDAHGRLQTFLGQDSGDIYREGFLIVSLPTGQRRLHTFYQRYGDWFGWICLGGMVLAAGRFAYQKNKRNLQ